MDTPYLDKRIEELENLADELSCGRSSGLEVVEEELSEMRIIKQLTLYRVTQQRELLLAYEQSKMPETWAMGKSMAECDIKKFLALNCG